MVTRETCGAFSRGSRFQRILSSLYLMKPGYPECDPWTRRSSTLDAQAHPRPLGWKHKTPRQLPTPPTPSSV